MALRFFRKFWRRRPTMWNYEGEVSAREGLGGGGSGIRTLGPCQGRHPRRPLIASNHHLSRKLGLRFAPKASTSSPKSSDLRSRPYTGLRARSRATAKCLRCRSYSLDRKLTSKTSTVAKNPLKNGNRSNLQVMAVQAPDHDAG